MGLLNLVRLPALAIVAARRITVRPILNAEEKKVIFPTMHLNGSSAKLGKEKGKAKGKAKAKPEETAIGKGKATAENHLAQTGRKETATASGLTTVASLMMNQKEEKEKYHHWQLKVLQRGRRNR